MTTPTTSSSRRTGIPRTATESDVRSTSRWNARTETEGSEATQTLTPYAASTPWPPAITPCAPHPMLVAAPRRPAAWARACSVWSGVPPETNTQARSGVAPSRPARADATARSAATSRSESMARPSPTRVALTSSW